MVRTLLLCAAIIMVVSTTQSIVNPLMSILTGNTKETAKCFEAGQPCRWAGVSNSSKMCCSRHCHAVSGSLVGYCAPKPGEECIPFGSPCIENHPDYCCCPAADNQEKCQRCLGQEFGICVENYDWSACRLISKTNVTERRTEIPNQQWTGPR